MIDINFTEIAVLVALAVILFGPERLPELARKAARMVAFMRNVGSDARAQLREELGPEFDDIRLSDLNPRNFVTRHILSGDEIEDLRAIREDAVASGQLVQEALVDAQAPSVPIPSAEPARVLFDTEAT